MMSSTAKAQCRVHFGAYCLDRALPGSRSMGGLVALVAALALLAALLSLASFARDWLAQPVSVSTATPTVHLGTPRVPTRAVEALERVDLSVVASNPTDRRIENVSLELSVLKPDGSSALVARQSHIALDPHDSRAIYWAWRVPAQLPSGAYGVLVNAFDADGRPLSGDQPVRAALQIVGRDTE